MRLPCSAPVFFAGAESAGVVAGSMVGAPIACDEHATARRAAIDTVAATRTIVRRGRRFCCQALSRTNQADLIAAMG